MRRKEVNKSERIAISNGLICILDMLKVLINPRVMKNKELINAAMEYIKSTEKQLAEFNNLVNDIVEEQADE